jgi:hypothetical protein
MHCPLRVKEVGLKECSGVALKVDFTISLEEIQVKQLHLQVCIDLLSSSAL